MLKKSGVLRIQLTSTLREELEKKKAEKVAQGYEVISEGVVHRYYGATYYCVVEIRT
jgi:hypothetical protein